MQTEPHSPTRPARFRPAGYGRTLVALALTLAALAVAAVAPTPASAAPAAGSAAGDRAAVLAAAQRVSSGTGSAADLDLVKSVPAIAGKVIDPSRTQVKVGDGSVAAQGGNRINEACTYAWIDLTYYSTLGFTVLTWRHYLEWCHDGQVVNRWRNRFDQLTFNDGTIQVNALLVNVLTAVPGWVGNSRLQRQMQACVLNYGCWATYTPWSQINAYYNGGWDYSYGG
jgi:hypothetical protein